MLQSSNPAPTLAANHATGTNIGGGTFWGLCKLLTGMDNFDDILSLSSLGDNSNVRWGRGCWEVVTAGAAAYLLPLKWVRELTVPA